MHISKTVNQDFFKIWTSEMAYVLGFFAADGNMMRHKNGGCYIEFYGTDQCIIKGIKRLLKSEHTIATRKRSEKNPKWKDAYRLQIGSKEIFNDLINLGMTPTKSNSLQMPSIPDLYFGDFVRGYFDGDGHISQSTYQQLDRKSKSTVIVTGFTSGSRIFLEKLQKRLISLGVVVRGTLYENKGYRLCFSIKDSLSLYHFMYRNKEGLNLDRKKSIFKHYFKLGT